MTSYYDFSIDSTTDLDAIALTRAGRVASHGYGYELNATPALPGGWRGRWIATKGMGNYGTFVLLPTDSRTRAIWREGQITRICGFGLSRREAVRVLDARIRHALEDAVLTALGAILACDGATTAWLTHRRCSGAVEREWFTAYADVIPALPAGMSHPRRCSLYEAVVACTGN